MARRIEALGGVSRILLSHRDDVADQGAWARHFGAERWIDAADADAAPGAVVEVVWAIWTGCCAPGSPNGCRWCPRWRRRGRCCNSSREPNSLWHRCSMAALLLRVQDVDVEVRQRTVRSDKGDKDRLTVFPSSLVEPLQKHLWVVLPMALGRKYLNAATEWGWQWVFP